MKPFHVRVTSASKFTNWYADSIGQVYLVADIDSDKDLCVQNSGKFIAWDDCEIVTNAEPQPSPLDKMAHDIALHEAVLEFQESCQSMAYYIIKRPLERAIATYLEKAERKP